MDINDLEGKTILIGREPDNKRLVVAMDVDGKTKMAALGVKGSVPNSVSRYRAEDHSAHCKIEIGTSGSIIVKQMKPDSKMFVNGVELSSKKITPQTQVQLGVDHYQLNVEAVLKIALQLAGVKADNSSAKSKSEPGVKPIYSISHLERVWDDYHEGDLALQKRQNAISLLSSIPLFFSMGAGALGGISGQMGWPDWVKGITLTMSLIALLVFIYGLYLRFTSHHIEKREELKDKLMRDYVCPNPKCHRFLNMQPFKLLKQNKKCPYCQCEWTEK